MIEPMRKPNRAAKKREKKTKNKIQCVGASARSGFNSLSFNGTWGEICHLLDIFFLRAIKSEGPYFVFVFLLFG